jgi:hypothetical protein
MSRLLEVGEAARSNRHWTDEEMDARLMRCLVDDALSCARWRTVLGGLGLAAMLVVGVMAVLAW